MSFFSSRAVRRVLSLVAFLATVAIGASPTLAQSHEGGEAKLVLPDLSQVTFFGGIDAFDAKNYYPAAAWVYIWRLPQP